MAKPKKFPQVLREGSVSVRIYKIPVNGCEAFTVSYHEGGQRKRTVSIFTPRTMRRILKEVREDLIPFVALSASGGLRPSEARRLLWENISWRDEYIEIHASQARKTLRDRFVPLLPNLRAWLEPDCDQGGLVGGSSLGSLFTGWAQLSGSSV